MNRVSIESFDGYLSGYSIWSESLSGRPEWFEIMIGSDDFSQQEQLLDNLADEKRLRILSHVVDGPVAAPELAERDEFDISSESILYHLNKLEQTGIVESSTVQGPYKRPRKEYRLSGNGRRLNFEVVENEYHFDFREPPVAPE